MKKFKAEYITSGIFLCVIIIFMSCIPFVYVMNKIEWRNKPNESINPELLHEWKILYPFDDIKEEYHEQRDSLFEHIKKWCELYTTEYIAFHYSILETAKLLEDAVKWNMASVSDYNAVIKLRDGYLTSYMESKDVTENAKSTTEFAEFCRQKGIDFFYANFPMKICVSEDKDISGVLDFSNQNADKFLAILNDSGVRNYDFGRLLHEDGMNHHEAFYITDHHWKAETGLWAAKRILRILRDNYGWNVKPEVLNPENFNYTVYRELFLGSHGKKVTLARIKPEDFTMIYPKFKTYMHYEIPERKIDTSGDFTVTYDMDALKAGDYYNKNAYTAYNHGDKALVNIENLMNDDGKKVLIIHDSFSGTVIPFLALGVQYTYSVDLRHFKGSLRSYILKHKPDLVIAAYNSAMTPATLNPELHDSVYDFR